MGILPNPRKMCTAPFGGLWSTQRARGSKKIILARTHEKIIPPRTKFSFSLEIIILVWKFHSRLKISIPNPVFFAAREGPGMKKPFSIENFIPYSKLDFFNMASRDWIFSILGPSGKDKLVGQKRCRTKSPRFFEFSTRVLFQKMLRIFVPNLARIFRALFPGQRGRQKFQPKSPQFFKAKSPRKFKKKTT